MNTNPRVSAYWQQFVAQHPEHEGKPYLTWGFGDSPEMADQLGVLVRSGVKTATAALLWEYENDQETMPTAGTLNIILDGAGDPLCIVETTGVAVKPFNEVGADFAYDEGEGDRTLEYWREVHWRFFTRRCGVLNREPSETMPVVCERFRLVFSE